MSTTQLTDRIAYLCPNAVRVSVKPGPGYTRVVVHTTSEREARKLAETLTRAGATPSTSDRRGKVHPLTGETLDIIAVSATL